MSFWNRHWWVFVVFVIGATGLHFSQEKKNTLRKLNLRLAQMEKEKSQVLAAKEDLELHLRSQNDPAWIEMVLMRELGVVPEGFLKVHFKG